VLRFVVDDEFEFDVVGCGRVDAGINEESIVKSISSIGRNVGAERLKRAAKTEDETPSEAGRDMGHSTNMPGAAVDIVNKAGKRTETSSSQLQWREYCAPNQSKRDWKGNRLCYQALYCCLQATCRYMIVHTIICQHCGVEGVNQRAGTEYRREQASGY
jgi:hypothetical protein